MGFFALQGIITINSEVNQRLLTLGSQWDAQQQTRYYIHRFFLMVYKGTLTEASLMLPSPAASLAILLMMGETLVGPYNWIFGRQFWYASTTPWISEQREHSSMKHQYRYLHLSVCKPKGTIRQIIHCSIAKNCKWLSLFFCLIQDKEDKCSFKYRQHRDALFMVAGAQASPYLHIHHPLG